MAIHITQYGCGRWGRNILRDLRTLGVEVAVVDPDPAARMHATQQGALAFEHAEQAGPEPDGFIVAVPTALHADVIEGLLASGRPIYVEKPLTDSPARAREIARRCGRRNLFVMEKWRHHPGVQALRQIAESGELGAVRGLRTTRVQWNQPHADVDSIWTLAPHDLSIACTILGKLPEPRWAASEGFRESGEGLVAVFGQDPWFVMEISTIHPQTRREVRLVCEHGLAILDDPLGDHVKIMGPASRGAAFEPERRAISQDLPLMLELEAFVDYLGGGPDPLCGIDEALASVEVIAALRSLAGLPQ